MIEKKRLSLDEVEAGEHYKECFFTYSSGQLNCSDVVFEHCEFQQDDFRQSEWLDCTFIQLNLSNSQFEHSVFYRCRFESCQLVGCDFHANRWKQTRVNESKVDYVTFDRASLDTCQFEKTQLRNAFFQDVKIAHSLIFSSCDLDEADFLDTKLIHVDVSTSYFQRLILSPTLLRGCRISPVQAIVIASLLGMDITDD